MTIFKLPKSGEGPRFEGRWDNRPEALDVDIFDVTDEESQKIKAQKEADTQATTPND